MRGKKSFFLWVLLFIFLTTYNFDFTANIENSIFPIREIELTGIKNSDENKIKKKLDEFKGKNIILISTKKLKETIKDFDFIREIKIKKIYPEKIKVEINEFKPLAIFVNDNERYLLLDAGRIVEYKEVSDSDSLPLVYGKGAENFFYIFHESFKELGFNKELIKNHTIFHAYFCHLIESDQADFAEYLCEISFKLDQEINRRNISELQVEECIKNSKFEPQDQLMISTYIYPVQVYERN